MSEQIPAYFEVTLGAEELHQLAAAASRIDINASPATIDMRQRLVDSLLQDGAESILPGQPVSQTTRTFLTQRLIHELSRSQEVRDYDALFTEGIDKFLGALSARLTEEDSVFFAGAVEKACNATAVVRPATPERRKELLLRKLAGESSRSMAIQAPDGLTEDEIKNCNYSTSFLLHLVDRERMSQIVPQLVWLFPEAHNSIAANLSRNLLAIDEQLQLLVEDVGTGRIEHLAAVTDGQKVLTNRGTNATDTVTLLAYLNGYRGAPKNGGLSHQLLVPGYEEFNRELEVAVAAPLSLPGPEEQAEGPKDSDDGALGDAVEAASISETLAPPREGVSLMTKIVSKTPNTFTVYPFGDESTFIEFDGPNVAEGYPGAIHICDGLVFVEDVVFRAPNGEQTRLTAAEATALALVAIGASSKTIGAYLKPYDAQGKDIAKYTRPLWSAYAKLGVRGLTNAAAAIAAAFEKGIFVPDMLPKLGELHPGRRDRFVDMAELFGRGLSHKEVAQALGIQPGTLFKALTRIEEDLKLNLERALPAVTFLACASGLLPKGSKSTTSGHTQESPWAERWPRMKTLSLQPFGTPSVLLEFDGQPLDQDEVDIKQGYLRGIRILKGLIRVEEVHFTDPEGARTSLTPKEVAALALKSLGAEQELIRDTLKLKSGGMGSSSSLQNAYRKLGVSGYNAGEMALALAFEKGIFVTEIAPSLQGLRSCLRDRLVEISQQLHEGKTISQLGQSNRKIYKDLAELRSYIALEGRLAVVFLAHAINLSPQKEQVQLVAAA